LLTSTFDGRYGVDAMYTAARFADRLSTHAAVEQLVQAGFARDELSIAMSEEAYDREFGASSVRSSGVSGVTTLRTPNPGGILIALVAGVKPVDREGTTLRIAGPLLDVVQRTRDLPAALGELGANAAEAGVIRDGILSGQLVVGVHASDDRAALARQVLELTGGLATQAA
jgi:hypothetical protein